MPTLSHSHCHLSVGQLLLHLCPPVFLKHSFWSKVVYLGKLGWIMSVYQNPKRPHQVQNPKSSTPCEVHGTSSAVPLVHAALATSLQCFALMLALTPAQLAPPRHLCSSPYLTRLLLGDLWELKSLQLNSNTLVFLETGQKDRDSKGILEGTEPPTLESACRECWCS